MSTLFGIRGGQESKKTAIKFALQPMPRVTKETWVENLSRLSSKLCENCKKPGCTRKCACKLVFYCGQECPKADRPKHKTDCRKALAKVEDAKRKHGMDHGMDHISHLLGYGPSGTEVEIARVFQAGCTHEQQGRYREAEPYFLEARRMTLEAWGEGHIAFGASSTTLGELYHRMGRYDEAAAMKQEGLRILRPTMGERSWEVGSALKSIGVTLYHQGKHEEALATLEEAHEILIEAVGTDHSTVAALLTAKGDCYHSVGRLDDARVVYVEALHIRRRVHGEEHPCVALAFANIAGILSKQGQHDEAVEMYSKALAIYSRALGIDDREVAMVHRNMATVKHRSGDVAGALESAREAVRIYNKLGITDTTSQEAAKKLMELNRISTLHSKTTGSVTGWSGPPSVCSTM